MAHHIVYLSDEGHKNTIANSSPGGKCIGESNFIVVGTEASSETLISSGFNAISAKFSTNCSVGVPSCTAVSYTHLTLPTNREV